jgi:hypothetical protein
VDSALAWQIIGANIDELVGVMSTVRKGEQVDVFCDTTGTSLSFSNPSGPSNIKLCTVAPPDLEEHYDLHPSGSGFVNGDGEQVAKEQLAAYLVQYILGARDGGAEWGWEFKLSGES